MNRTHFYSISDLIASGERGKYGWYDACDLAAALIGNIVPEHYRSRTFSGIIGDIKVLPSRKALSLVSRKKGLGLQYARLYLTHGIDQGYGYQACASEALRSVLHDSSIHIEGDTLDAGCAVGVVEGVLGLEHVTGFDLFPDLLRAAQLVDALSGRDNRYAAADMTAVWPFAGESFDTVISALVCHHLKEQRDVRLFFSEACRVLRPGGSMIITLPAGSISRPDQLSLIIDALDHYGMEPELTRSGMVVSADDPHSLFWMFMITVRKAFGKHTNTANTFIHPTFGFPEFRTPVTRAEKGERARTTAAASRHVKHTAFRLIELTRLRDMFGEDNIVFPALIKRYGLIRTGEGPG